MSQTKHAKKPVPADWHPADILAALHKAGWSLRQLAATNGYRHRSGFSVALRHPYPKVEAIIARALGLGPQEIWPSRYRPDGSPCRRPGPAPMRPARPGKPKTGTAGAAHKPARDRASE